MMRAQMGHSGGECIPKKRRGTGRTGPSLKTAGISEGKSRAKLGSERLGNNCSRRRDVARRQAEDRGSNVPLVRAAEVGAIGEIKALEHQAQLLALAELEGFAHPTIK